MKTVNCAKCGKEIKDGQPAIAITDGEIDQAGAGGFRADAEQYIAIYCGNCCDVFAAVDNAAALRAALEWQADYCDRQAQANSDERALWWQAASKARATIAKTGGR